MRAQKKKKYANIHITTQHNSNTMQSSANIESIMTHPILELQAGILELQSGLQIYLQELINSLKTDNAPADLINEGDLIAETLRRTHEATVPTISILLAWTRRCCS